MNKIRTARPHQRDTTRFIMRVDHPAIFEEMRLGKTLALIRAFRLMNLKRILVIAPNSALGSWERELELEGEEDVVFLQGTAKKRKEALGEGHMWSLINREGWRSLPEIGTTSFDAAVLDESASCIRYPRSQITKFFLRNFRNIGKRVIMTGRPDPSNNLLDYWPQMAWLHGGSWLGCDNFYQFRLRYFTLLGYDWKPKKGTEDTIKQQLELDAIVLQRKHVGLDVPKVFAPRYLNFPSDLKDIYHKAEKKFLLETSGGDKSTKYQIVKYQWLRQMTGGIIDGTVRWKGKLTELRELLLGELAEEKVVTWFSYNAELEEVFDSLGSEVSIGRITGEVQPKERREVEESFRSDDLRVLCCQVKIADAGGDFGAADTEVFYSLPFGTPSWVQSQDRILGNLTKPGVLVVPLLVRDTVDEDVYQSLTAVSAGSRQFMDDVYQRIQRRHP